MPSGILARFLRSMAGLALAPALVMGLLLLRATRSGMQEAVLELQSKLAETSARRIAETLRGVDSRVGFVRTELTRPSLDWRAKQDILKGWLESEPEVEEVSLLRNGREILRVYDARSVPPGRSSRAADPAYRQLRRTGRRALRMIPRAGAPTRLEAYYPLAPGADLRVGMSLRSLWGWLTGERVGGTGYVVLLGPKGEPIIYSPLAGLEAGSRSAHWPVVAAALQARTVGSTEYEDLDGRMQVAAYAPVPEIGGAVLVQQSRAQAYAAALRMQRVGAMILIVVCALALLVAAAMARSMTGPLLELTRAAERVSAGEFPEAAVVATGDELQGLADTFARMVARLKGYAELQVDRLLVEQKRTEAILFSIGDGILVAGTDGIIQLANRRALELLGRPPGEEAAGRPLAQLLPAEGPLRDAVLQLAADPSEKVVKEVDLSDEDRRQVVRVWARPLVSPTRGGVLGTVTVVHDVTLEKELDRMKEEIVSSISHDLRSPISSIMGFLDFLKKGVAGVLNERQKEMVESMLRSAGRLLAMVNNILDVARLDSQAVQVKLARASLAGLAGRAIETLNAIAQRRGISVELQAEEEFSVDVDAEQIERVFANLISNALKFSPDDARIVVSLRHDEERIEASVEDQGPGIPAQYLERVFEKFEQVPGTRHGGTGLGLTICRRFVEAHGGRIWAESAPGKGARFRFTIPKSPFRERIDVR